MWTSLFFADLVSGSFTATSSALAEASAT